jgi:hypothetical protein
MICPVMSTQVKKIYETSTPSYYNHVECVECECAWWVNHRCAIAEIARIREEN